MTSFYSREELQKMGFKSLGEPSPDNHAKRDLSDILISRKASIYSPETISIGSHVRIDDFCILSGHIEIGNYIHIAAYTALYGGESGIYIKDFANLSSRISIYSVSDDYSGETMTNPMIPEAYKNIHNAPVYIERHVLIGATSVILPGVTLKEGSAFGCFSFINHDSESWSLNAGIPFQKIGKRSQNLLKLEQNFLNMQ